MQKIAQNGGMYQQMMAMQQQMLMLAQMVDQEKGTNLAQQMMSGMGGSPAPAAPDAGKTQDIGGGENTGEASNTKKARQRVAESTSPT